MNPWHDIKALFGCCKKQAEPEHLRRGRLGEQAAKKRLKQNGLRFLTANFRSKRGEIDLIFRDGDCLVFIEVKTRAEGGWTRPAAAVNARKRNTARRRQAAMGSGFRSNRWRITV